MKHLSLLILAVAISGISCERHEFDGPNGTKQLNESHDKHAGQGDHEKTTEKAAH